jgi:hypothetical protein
MIAWFLLGEATPFITLVLMGLAAAFFFSRGTARVRLDIAAARQDILAAGDELVAAHPESERTCCRNIVIVLTARAHCGDSFWPPPKQGLLVSMDLRRLNGTGLFDGFQKLPPHIPDTIRALEQV